MSLFFSSPPAPPTHSPVRARTRTTTGGGSTSSPLDTKQPTTPSTPTKRQQLVRRSKLSPIKFRTGSGSGSGSPAVGRKQGGLDWEEEGAGGGRDGSAMLRRSSGGGSRVRTRVGSVVEPLLLQTRVSPLDIPELLHMILQHVVDDSFSAAAACLLVNQTWFAVGAVLLWREVRFEDCGFVFQWATENKRNRRVGASKQKTADPILYARMMLYTTSVHSVHITEVVEPGESVDVMILRRHYPLMLPFVSLRAVILHRLSPSAFYKEEFVYSVTFPEMWLDLSSTKCTHELDILSSSTSSSDTRFIATPAAALEVPRLVDPATLVWIQTSVFVHYQHLTEFCLKMPPTWSLEKRHASDLLKSIGESPNKDMLRTLVISCAIPSSSTSGALLLQTLPNLEHVELECGLDDRNVQIFAKAWPKLRYFVLRAPVLRNGRGDRVGEFTSPKVTINALRYLTFYCTLLSHIELDLLPVAYPFVHVQKIPIFRPKLEFLAITGWNAVHAKFIIPFAIKAVPAPCDFRLRKIALAGLKDLFWDEGVDGERPMSEEDWKIKIQAERQARRKEMGPGWQWE